MFHDLPSFFQLFPRFRSVLWRFFRFPSIPGGPLDPCIFFCSPILRYPHFSFIFNRLSVLGSFKRISRFSKPYLKVLRVFKFLLVPVFPESPQVFRSRKIERFPVSFRQVSRCPKRSLRVLGVLKYFLGYLSFLISPPPITILRRFHDFPNRLNWFLEFRNVLYGVFGFPSMLACSWVTCIFPWFPFFGSTDFSISEVPSECSSRSQVFFRVRGILPFPLFSVLRKFSNFPSLWNGFSGFRSTLWMSVSLFGFSSIFWGSYNPCISSCFPFS